MDLGHGHRRSVLILWAWTALLSTFVLYPTITGQNPRYLPFGMAAIGLVLFTDRVERFIPPKKGAGHVMRVVAEILNAKPTGRGTDVTCALDLLGHVAQRRSVAFLLSDFIAPDYERALRIASARHDLIPIQIVDPRELELPDLGVVLAEDLETGELFEVDTTRPAARKAYAEWMPYREGTEGQIYRRLQFGDLVDLFMLDTRIHGRDRQAQGPSDTDTIVTAVGVQAINRIGGTCRIDPSSPETSVMTARMRNRDGDGTAQMPPITTEYVHEDGVQLVADFIAGLRGDRTQCTAP